MYAETAVAGYLVELDQVNGKVVILGIACEPKSVVFIALVGEFRSVPRLREHRGR